MCPAEAYVIAVFILRQVREAFCLGTLDSQRSFLF